MKEASVAHTTRLQHWTSSSCGDTRQLPLSPQCQENTGCFSQAAERLSRATCWPGDARRSGPGRISAAHKGCQTEGLVFLSPSSCHPLGRHS